MGATERKMQIQIFVLVVAALALSNGAPQAAKVKVFGLYETMCPDCIRWVAHQAKPVMEVDFVPLVKPVDLMVTTIVSMVRWSARVTRFTPALGSMLRIITSSHNISAV